MELVSLMLLNKFQHRLFLLQIYNYFVFNLILIRLMVQLYRKDENLLKILPFGD